MMQFEQNEVLGVVISVDTGTAIIDVQDEDKLTTLQVNRLVALESGRGGQHLIGIIQKITRSIEEIKNKNTLQLGQLTGEVNHINLVRIALVGTFFDIKEGKKDIFRRSVQSVPEINAKCFPIEGELPNLSR